MLLLALSLLQPPAQPAAAPVAKVVVTPSQATVVAGDSVLLVGKAVDAASRPTEAAILYSQGAGRFEGKVDRTGWVKGGSPGTVVAVVSAVQQGKPPVVQRVEIKVVAGAPARVAVEPRVTTLVAGQSVPLSAHGVSALGDISNTPATWTSSNAAVATVSASGQVTARSAGRATLTATVNGVSTTVPITVVGGPVSTATLTPSSARVRQGDVVTLTFRATVGGAARTDLSPVYAMSGGNGQIDPDGRFVAYGEGTYVVTAVAGPATASTTITVAERDVGQVFELVGKSVKSRFTTEEVWVHPNGKVAYLGSGSGGDVAYVIDVSNPADPKVVDSLLTNTRRVNDLMTDADGKILVHTREGASDRKNGIVIYTLDDPLHPKKVSEFTETVTAGVHSSFVYRDKKTGQLNVFITNDGTGAVHVINLDDPAKPRELAQWTTPRDASGRSLHDIDIQDGLLYGSWWNDGLVILDVGNGIKGGTPAKPQFVSQYKYDLDKLYKKVELKGGPGYIRGTHTAWRHKNYVFIGDEVFGAGFGQGAGSELTQAWGRLQVIDVSDILHPKSVAYWEPDYGGVHNVWARADTLYVGAYNAGFHAIDISGELRGDLKAQNRTIATFFPSDPKAVVPNATMTWGVVVKGDLIYINDMYAGLFIGKIKPKPGRITP
ncbi:MAG: Ig-like domain-containing protein [Gemmatimonadaceae bacterium]|nr:Ig-like domain-containing protein [Gemmatimonadaceae bacterium]